MRLREIEGDLLDVGSGAGRRWKLHLQQQQVTRAAAAVLRVRPAHHVLILELELQRGGVPDVKHGKQLGGGSTGSEAAGQGRGA